MKCRTCKEDVPPKFSHALSVNICPLCGGEIMEIKLKNILGELKIALEDAKEYMSEVEDWLLSNYCLKKVNNNEIVIDKNKYEQLCNLKNNHELVNKSSDVFVNRNDGQIENDVVEQTQTPFAKRAGIITHKKALEFIKGRTSGAADPSEFVGEDEEYGEMGEDYGESLDEHDENEMSSLFKDDAPPETRMQKLKRLQKQNSGEGLVIRRSS